MKRFAGWIVLAVVILAVIVLHPWTVRAIDASGDVVDPNAFDASTDAASLWTGKVLPAAGQPAASAGDQAAFLTGSGKVLSIDTSSEVGLAMIDLTPGDGKADIAMQVGPVTRGTDIRDALGLKFGDFDTQVDYANIANALNAKALGSISALSDPKALAGKTITFKGAGERGPDGVIQLMPVSVEVAP